LVSPQRNVGWGGGGCSLKKDPSQKMSWTLWESLESVGSFFCSSESPNGRYAVDDAEEADIALIGESFLGTGKYLGGAKSKIDGCIYAIPGHAKRVLKIDPTSREVTLVGPVFEGKYKWLRAAEGPDGALYGIPCHANRVLRILPKEDDDPEIELVGPEFPGEWLWHGGVMASDGAIYCIPQSATRVLRLRFEPLRIDLVGPAWQGKWKWYGGLRSGNCVYGIPACARSVLKIETQGASDGVSEQGDASAESSSTQEPAVSCIGELDEGGWKWHGGVVCDDGTVLGAPSNAHEVLQIKGDSVTTVGSRLKGGQHRDDDKYKFLGAVVGKDGCCYCIPSDADFVLKIDPKNGTVANFGHSLAYLAKGQSRGQNKWQGGALLGDGKIYCIPLKAEVVLRIDTDRGCVETLSHPARGLNLWEGGVVADDGALYCMPLKCPQVLRIAPGNDLEPIEPRGKRTESSLSGCSPFSSFDNGSKAVGPVDADDDTTAN